jgi:hypothetical protein
MQPQYRQGDLLFIWQETRPEANLTARPGNVIVVSEATSHAHRLQAGTILEAPDGALYLDVTHVTRVVHEEHGPITLDPGLWLVRVQPGSDQDGPGLMDTTLRLQPGQQVLTPAQEAEAWRFAEESLRRQLSTEPVDEQEAETLLRQVYKVAGLAPPRRVYWLDGPLQLAAVMMQPSREERAWGSVGASVGASVEASARNSVWNSVGANVRVSVWESVGANVRANVWESVGVSVWESVEANVPDSVPDRVRRASVEAYHQAFWLAFYRFFDAYLAPNDLHALARFNQMVSGYWLGQDAAVMVRRPGVLCRDAAGRLHSATGKCMEYHDGWGFWAWHGVRVPEKVILAPEQLTWEDLLGERDVEVRRIMQERMRSRFVPELGGVAIDAGPRGTLFEVR